MRRAAQCCSDGARRKDAVLQARESCEIAIERHPFATPFDRERCIPGVRRIAAAGTRSDAKIAEDVPVAFPRLDHLAVRLRKKAIAKREGILERSWNGVGSPVGHDANNTCKAQFRDRKASVVGCCLAQPGSRNPMRRGVLPIGVDQYIDVRKLHRKPHFSLSMYSRSCCSSMSLMLLIPDIKPPVSLPTGISGRAAAFVACLSETT